jgi:hypothetical protein
MIAHRWDLVEPQLDKWLQEANAEPGELAAFGRRFLQLKQFEKATEVLQDAVTLPDNAPRGGVSEALGSTSKAPGQWPSQRAANGWVKQLVVAELTAGSPATVAHVGSTAVGR